MNKTLISKMKAAHVRWKNPIEPTITIPRKTLEDWRICLSQGDNSPRWAIENLLEKS